MFSNAISWIGEHPSQFLRALGQHLTMSCVSLAIAMLIALPLAVFIVNNARFAFTAINIVNGIRTLPSLAILAVMMPILGIGMTPSIVALTILALPPVLLNTYIGLRDADPDAIEAAIGMGMDRRQVLRKVRIPLAAPAIFAGIRTATVQVLAGATLAPFIGGGGLGDFIATGIGIMDMSRLLVGAVPIAILALLTELAFGLTERKLFSARLAL